MTLHELAAALVRTTLATSAATCLAVVLLRLLKVQSPRTHRIAWLLVILQGWLLFPWTLQLESPPAPPPLNVASAMPTSAWAWEQLPTTHAVVTFAEQTAPPRRLADVAAPAALAAWLVGLALAVLVAAWRYARIVRTLPLGTAPNDPRWRAEWRRARATIRNRGPRSRQRGRVHFRIAEHLGPLLAFIPWQYLILAPRPLWFALTADQREAILRHELAHLHRGDLWKSLAIRALALPQWFNPLAWLAVRRFDEAAEWACDDAVARGDNAAPLTLAQSLVSAAELLQPTPAAPAGALPFHGGVLARRIHRLVTPRFKEESNMKRLIVPLLLAGIAAAQLIRLERVAASDSGQSAAEAEAPANPSRSRLSVPAPAPVPVLTPPSPVDSQPSDSPKTIAEWMAQPREDRDKLQDEVARAFESGDPRRYAAAVRRLPYVIEPPDILAVQCVSLIPNESYVPNPRDVVHITITGGGDRPNVDAIFQIAADGAIDLGKPYGQVHLAGQPVLFLRQYNNIAPVRILERQLTKELGVEKVSIAVVTTATNSEVSGQHLVAMDGCVNLGVYGAVFVAGKTIDETRLAIEKKLREKADIAEVSVDVHAANSKVYYIITQGGEKGDDVVRAPITGNETVLDAIAALGGLPIAGDVRIWVARPAPKGVGAEQILPVVWHEIARGINAATNYKLLPGDRLFIEPKPPVENPQASPVPVGATEAADLVGRNAPVPRRRLPPILGPITSGAEIVTLDPPSDDEVMHVREKSQPVWRSLLGEPSQKVVRIVKEKIAEYVDAPRDYPLVGPAQQHHVHYKCTIDYENGSEVIYVDHNHLHMVEKVDAAADNRQGPPPIPVEHPQASPVDATEAFHAAAYDRSAGKEGESRLEALERQRAVLILLRMPDGRSVERSEQIAGGATIGQVLNNVTFPYPVDLAKAQITVSRQDRTWMLGRIFEGQRRWTVGWDEAANTVVASDDNPLKPGDRISIDMSPPPATRVGDLRAHDVITVLHDYGVKSGSGRPQISRIACEIKEIRPNGNLSIEGQQTIYRQGSSEEQCRNILTGEVRREAIQPDLTVSSSSIVNLKIVTREVNVEAAPTRGDSDGKQDGVWSNPGYALTEADDENRPTRPLAAVLHDPLRFGPPAVAPVTKPNPTPDAVPRIAAAPAPPPGTVIRQPAPGSGAQVMFKTSFIRDRSGDVADLGRELRNAGRLCSDASTIQGALRIMEKHGLIQIIADPVIVTLPGRPATLTLAGAAPQPGQAEAAATQPMTIEIRPGDITRDEEGRRVMVEVRLSLGNNKLQFGRAIHFGETLIFATRRPHPPHDTLGVGQTYLVVTPEIVE